MADSTRIFNFSVESGNHTSRFRNHFPHWASPVRGQHWPPQVDGTCAARLRERLPALAVSAGRHLHGLSPGAGTVRLVSAGRHLRLSSRRISSPETFPFTCYMLFRLEIYRIFR